MMLKRRYVFILLSVSLSTLMLTQFQNCAPAGGSGSVASSSENPDVRLVDDMNKSAIQFVSEDVQIHDEAEIALVSGLCSRQRNGAALRWAIWTDREQARPLSAGSTLCNGGQFEVELAKMDDLVCGVDHVLVVEAPWGGSTFTHVIRRCQPLVTEEIASPVGSPMGTMCALEYEAEASTCKQVCYRQDKVVSELQVEAARCSGLVARLAGP